MSYGTDGLTFNTLRNANEQRRKEVKRFGNRDWKLSGWSNAILGELGEAANLIKKVERGDFPLADVRRKLADELADVQCYLDILACEAGINLGEATMEKWNEISEREGCKLYIDAEDWHRRD